MERNVSEDILARTLRLAQVDVAPNHDDRDKFEGLFIRSNSSASMRKINLGPLKILSLEMETHCTYHYSCNPAQCNWHAIK